MKFFEKLKFKRGSLAKKKPLVLHVHTLPVVSGSGLNTLIAMRAAREEGYDAALACQPGGALEEEVIREGFIFYPIKSLDQPIRPLRDLFAFLSLLKLIRKLKPQIVHTHNSKAGILGRLAAAMVRHPFIVHTFHGYAYLPSQSFLLRFFLGALKKFAGFFTDVGIVISKPLASWVVSEGFLPPYKIRLVYSGIDSSKFDLSVLGEQSALRGKLKILEGSLVLGIVSKLWKDKGHRVLIQAIKKLLPEYPSLLLLIIGDGFERAGLEAFVKGQGLESHIRFLGFRKDIPELTSLLDIAVLPSFHEGMGRVVLEAMAMAKPVVASEVGGIPDLIKDGVNGFLIPPNRSSSLANALFRLLGDRGLREEMGKKGREMFEEGFTEEMMKRQMRAIYGDLIKEGSDGKGLAGTLNFLKKIKKGFEENLL